MPDPRTYAGLLAIHAYHTERGEAHRDVCRIRRARTAPTPPRPPWWHVRVVGCRENGDVDLTICGQRAEHADLCRTDDHLSVHARRVRARHRQDLRGRPRCRRPRVYVDGANSTLWSVWPAPESSAATSATRTCTHKTFCIPHGGGEDPVWEPVAVPRTWPPTCGSPAGPGAAGLAVVSRSAVRFGVDPADHLGLYPHDGSTGLRRRRWWPPRRAKLHRPPPRRFVPPALYTGENGMRGPRGHPGSAADHQGHRRHRRRRGEAVGGLRTHRATGEPPGGRHTLDGSKGQRSASSAEVDAFY